MSCQRLILISAVMLIAACLFGACVGMPLQPDGSPAPADETSSQGFVREDLGAALALLDAYMEESGAGGTCIALIQGVDVDISGNARTWLIGARSGNETRWYIYSDGTWKMMNWHAPVPAPTISLNETALPSEVYAEHHAEISGIMEEMETDRSDLRLTAEGYRITIRNATDIADLQYDARI